jgi:hemerythrin-like domain-containing protein
MEKRRNGTNDAIRLLKQDHERVKKLLSSLAETTPRALKKRQDLLEEIAEEIRIHSRIEEEIFYPAYAEAARSHEDAKLFFEAKEEHGLVDVLLPTLESEDPAGETFGAKAKVLKDLIEHHAEEEESEMFPRAQKLLGKERLEELGRELMERKEQLKESGEPVR